ncbi:MAG: MarR family transcriptional regulator [Clostridia bacterium]|nr:MarR family transcriptional regulator [Clostridia bacterium]
MPSIMRNMNTIGRCQGLYRSHKMPESDLCPIHHPFVFAICNNPGMSQDWLAKHLSLNKSTVARSLSHLESTGYAERRLHPEDKRITLVYPTEKMLGILPTVRQVAHEWTEEISRVITPEEMEQFCAVLEKLAEEAKRITKGFEEKKNG